MTTITDNVRQILRELPDGVQLVAVAKTRTAAEVREAIEAGVRIVGQNYLQEALPVVKELSAQYGPGSATSVKWHFIGHMQSNKIGHIVSYFQMIETLDRLKHAHRLQRLAQERDLVIPVLLEINSAREQAKQGLLPEELPEFLTGLALLDRVSVQGLMTMGPMTGDPDATRQSFRDTNRLFRELVTGDYPGVTMKYLSMGMSASWRIAVEEGANVIRVGSDIFGPRR